jgi:hypothetical protein
MRIEECTALEETQPQTQVPPSYGGSKIYGLIRICSIKCVEPAQQGSTVQDVPKK